ncbi:SRPBCC family protein [Nocardioides sp. GXZ039]|uniref:SRPBCC family protein n=1 Tax=Nocardioides sp. GXZ039 TaxID=3136018 RepID=UPI0030F3B721
MDLTHKFTVPVGVEETWAAFQDIASLAECFPGAQVTEADGDSFSGSVKVKLGPIALVYNGSGTFVEKDAAAHRFLVDAKGKDKRGNGTAGAKVTLTMSETSGPDGPATDVEVITDLAITGKPAQFGRGVMQDVSDKLLGQFVACLEQRFAEPEPEPEPAPTPEPRESTPLADAAAASVREAPAAVGSSASVGSTTPKPAAAPSGAASSPPPEDDALDLGAAVLPVLARTYWKQALGALVVVWLLRRWLRR